MKWLAPGADSVRAAELPAEHSLAAPAIIFAEVTNAIWKKQVRGEAAGELRITALWGALELVEPDSTLAEPALALARQLAQPVYACLYLALALRRGERLITADERFLRRCAGTAYADQLLDFRDWA